MGPELVCAALLLAAPRQDGDAVEALARGDLAGALDAAQAATAGAPRAQLEAEVYHRARDFPRVLRACREGLEAEPGNLVLLWRAAAAEIWLQDGARAAAWTSRLEGALDVADLDEAVEAQWRGTAADFRARADALSAAEAAARRCLERAKLVTVALVGAAGGGLALALRRRAGV